MTTIHGYTYDEHSGAEVDAMHTAWFKAVTLTVTLWSQPYQPARW